MARWRARPGPRRQERVLWQGRPAWRSFAVRWALAGWLVALGASKPEVQSGLTLLAGMIGLSILVTRLRYAYTVTTRRVLEREGLLAQSVSEVRVVDITNIRLLQSPLERCLGVGALELSSAGGTAVEVVFWRIAAPAAVRALIRRFQ